MKWLWIVIALAFVLIGYAPQLRTRPRVAVIRHYGIAVSFPRTIVRFEVVRR
jgi:hypothetical protein